MIINKKYLKIFSILLLIAIITLLIKIYISKSEKESVKAKAPITINLLTSVHPNLPWKFEAKKSKIFINPGDVMTIEYLVKNLDNKENTGIATFAYFPKEFGTYIRKLNCFCYDAKTLKPNQQEIYSVVILMDPEVTKNSKTKNVKEVTIQFTFFDYKEYKEKKG